MNNEMSTKLEDAVNSIESELETIASDASDADSVDSADSDSDLSIDKKMYYIAFGLMTAEIHTRTLKTKGLITKRDFNKITRRINDLRKIYKDLFSKLKDTDVSYIW